MASKSLTLVIIAPCYNEEAIIPRTSNELLATLDYLENKGKVSKDSFILYVNDGSIDRTWQLIESQHSIDTRICGISLSKNVGHQMALLAGMMYVKDFANAVITIDADLQDDLHAMEEMLDKSIEGFDIVYGIKVVRNVDSWTKRNSAKLYYKIQQCLGMNIIPNHADYRLLTHKALTALSNYPENNLYLRGLIPLLGMKSTTVNDIIKARPAGASKYTIKKMLTLALDGITSFSTKPLELIFVVGLLMLIASFMMFGYIVLSIMIDHYTPGWASIMVSIWFIGSVLTMAIGLVGIYIGKIYIEVKNRPTYTISEVIGIGN